METQKYLSLEGLQQYDDLMDAKILSGDETVLSDAKSHSDSNLVIAKTYTDEAVAKVKNDLLNGAGAAYDTLQELGDLIDDNVDAIDALEKVAAGKADKVHTHVISDVNGLQSVLDGKASSSHGTHVSYSTTAPVMDGTASVGSASTVARSDHKHPTDTSRASKTEFDSHNSDTTKHITSTERTNWGAAYTHSTSAHAPSNAQPNQNAFSNVKVGSTTVSADTTTDTIEFVGSNVTITPDATNDKVTFTVADGTTSAKGVVKLTNSTSSTSTTTAATPSSVKSAYDLANTAKTNAATAQTKADSAYTLADGKVGRKVDGQIITLDGVQYTGGANAEIFNDYEANIATGAYSHAEGSYNKASGNYSHAEGYGTTASGNHSHTEGSNNIASEENSHAEGEGSTASGLHSHAEGLNVVASALAAHAEGTLTIVDGQSAHAEGFQTASMGYASHAEGYGTHKIPDTITSSTANSTVIEAWQSSKFTMAKGRGSHAEGYDTLAVSTYAAHAEGGKTLASGNYSHAEGEYSTASGLRSHAEGYQTIASSTNQHVQGRYNIEDTASKYAHIVGNGSYNTDRSNAHTLDWNGNGWFKGDVYVGGNSQDEGSPLVKKSDASWTLIYDSGSISSKVNSISNINVSGYTNIQVAVRCYNRGDSADSRTGSAIFTATNGKTYQFPVWTSMFSKTTGTTSAMANFNLVSGWLICPSASKLTGNVDIFSTTEGGTSGNLTHTGSGILKCSSELSTLTISSLDQSAQHYFGSGSRVMVWGCKV